MHTTIGTPSTADMPATAVKPAIAEMPATAVKPATAGMPAPAVMQQLQGNQQNQKQHESESSKNRKQEGGLTCCPLLLTATPASYTPASAPGFFLLPRLKVK